MSDNKPRPELSDKGNREAELRRQRQAEALRANLQRRKAQTRGRAEDTPPQEEGGEPPRD